jgi:hypothetical protein
MLDVRQSRALGILLAEEGKTDSLGGNQKIHSTVQPVCILHGFLQIPYTYPTKITA